jgi:hypothetical protein
MQNHLLKDFPSISLPKKMNHKILLSVFLAFCLSLVVVSAWPYQMNLSDGSITDLNSSNSLETNLTIYVLNYTNVYINYSNYTYFTNVTNITYLNVTNVTCYNCTYNYNNTYIMNGTLNGSYYNKSDDDSRFVTIGDFDSYKNSLSYPYASSGDFNNLVTRVNAINITGTGTSGSNGLMWGGIIIAIIASVVAIFMAFMIGNRE